MNPLPHLHLSTSSDDADPHRAEEIVCRVGVKVNPAVEDRRGVLPNRRGDERLATGVLLDEVRDVVDDAGDRDEGPGGAVGRLRLGDEIVPLDYRKLVKGDAPVQLGSLLVELLLQLLDPPLLDLVLPELLQVIGQADLLPQPDHPLRRVVLVPLDGISVVRGEFVVEVVIALAEGHERRDPVIARGVAVVKGLVAEPVGEGVDAERRLLHEGCAENTSIDETADWWSRCQRDRSHVNVWGGLLTPITPSEAAD